MNARRRVDDPRTFGRVAVLYGGDSAEREVSLASGEQVLEALLRAGVDAYGIDKGPDVVERLAGGGFDRVVPMLHGRGGEDGTLQGALEVMGLPYTGTGVLGSALAMDKHRTKLLWRSLGLPTPEHRLVRAEDELGAAVEALGFPVVVKPVHEGSSIGVSLVADEEQLLSGWFEASRFDADVMVERLVQGPEYTIAILDGEALPVIALETPREFYDYEAKYADGMGTRYLCPCGLAEAPERRIQSVAVAAFEAIGGTGWGRVDLLCDDDGEPWLIDVNTVPGMTGHSLVPMAAAAAGIDLEQLVWRILETSLPAGGQR